MAPCQKPSLLHITVNNPFYCTATLSSSTSDLFPSVLDPPTLEDRPHSAHSLPTPRYRKNVKEMTGFTTTEEEFEALPIAVRRKYFSTLERLRFAQNSRTNAINDLPIETHRKSTLADRRGLTVPVIEPRRRNGPSRRSARKTSRRQSLSSNEVSWFLTLPDKIKRKQFTREEQVILAGRLRESVILDAADEAIYKASRRASRNLTPLYHSGVPSPCRDSMDSRRDSKDSTSSIAAAIYESFRWMDEEEDLNLKLQLDDYHANLDGFVIPSPTSNRRPSFRRQMSITKLPFARSSLSSPQARSPKFEYTPTQNTSHERQRSRALSIIAPRHMPNCSVTSIDPNATHYQDPEARLKLRVYLASPQKFDEAIEFGFPSIDGVTDGQDKENRNPKRASRDVLGYKKSSSTDKGHSFLNDDTVSLFEDDTSMVDPDSPLTPADFRSQHRTSPTFGSRAGKTSADLPYSSSGKPSLVKQPESYAQAMAGSREMTLRMTLTRPDLRADETTLYGWQAATTKSSLREKHVLFEDLEEKFDVKNSFGSHDPWGPSVDKENGVVKRFWNKVRSSQRRIS